MFIKRWRNGIKQEKELINHATSRIGERRTHTGRRPIALTSSDDAGPPLSSYLLSLFSFPATAETLIHLLITSLRVQWHGPLLAHSSVPSSRISTAEKKKLKTWSRRDIHLVPSATPVLVPRNSLRSMYRWLLAVRQVASHYYTKGLCRSCYSIVSITFEKILPSLIIGPRTPFDRSVGESPNLYTGRPAGLIPIFVLNSLLLSPICG